MGLARERRERTQNCSHKNRRLGESRNVSVEYESVVLGTELDWSGLEWSQAIMNLRVK